MTIAKAMKDSANKITHKGLVVGLPKHHTFFSLKGIGGSIGPHITPPSLKHPCSENLLKKKEKKTYIYIRQCYTSIICM